MKTLITWNEKYSIGIDEIDNQHQQLIDTLNKLFDAMSEGKGKQILESIFDDLTNYTVNHFSTEEKCMIVHAFPEYINHKNEHKKLIEDVNAFKKEYLNGNTKISIELIRYLKDWLLNHILGSDKELGNYLKQNQVL